MWIREHQRPWTFGAIVADDAAALKRSLLDECRQRAYRRAWLVVGGDRGFWREERLCLRRGGTWAFVTDAEPRVPAHPELIPTFEAQARRAIERDGIVEGTLRGRTGLLLVGVDADQRTLYGLAGDRDLLDLFWQIRFRGRIARGTTPG